MNQNQSPKIVASEFQFYKVLLVLRGDGYRGGSQFYFDMIEELNSCEIENFDEYNEFTNQHELLVSEKDFAKASKLVVSCVKSLINSI